MSYVIGLDGGGTKTLLRAVDANGNVLYETAGGGSNIYSLGDQNVRLMLHDLITGCIDHIGAKPSAVCIGSAGVVNKEPRNRLALFLRESSGCEAVSVVTDAEIALYANLADQPGVSITSGTGSICLAKNKYNQIARTSGWGHLFSDEGSAYFMAVKALSHICKAFDGRGQPTLLTDLFLKRLGSLTFEDMINRIYQDYASKRELASLADLVDAAAEQQDTAASEIITDTASELYEMCHAVISKLDMSRNTFCVVLNGGVLIKSQPVRRAFLPLLSEMYPSCTLKNGEYDAAWGAVYLAKKYITLE